VDFGLNTQLADACDESGPVILNRR
jgi:hypothetical protein